MEGLEIIFLLVAAIAAICPVAVRITYNRKCGNKSLKASRDRALKTASDEIYSKLFKYISEPIQELIGLMESRENFSASFEMALRKIESKLKRAMELCDVKINENSIDIPVDMSYGVDLLSKSNTYSKDELEQAILYFNNEAESAKKHQITKSIIITISRELYKLINISELDKTELEAIMKRIKEVLTENGVYPLYKDDRELVERPDLRELFI